MRNIASALFAALLLAALPSRADPAEQARAAFQRGQTEYNLGNFAEAARLFEETYRFKPVPALLFNIAQCYRFVGDLEKASRAYRSFVRNAPANDRNLQLGRELLAQVETALASRKHAETSAPHGLAQNQAPGDKAGSSAPGSSPGTATAPGLAAASGATPAPAIHPAGDLARPAGTAIATATSTALRPPPSALATTPSVSAAPAEPRTRVFTWIAAGGAGLALGGGALFASKSSSSLSELRTGYHDRATIDTQSASAKSDAGKANLLLISGVALAALTGALFVMRF